MTEKNNDKIILYFIIGVVVLLSVNYLFNSLDKKDISGGVVDNVVVNQNSPVDIKSSAQFSTFVSRNGEVYSTASPNQDINYGSASNTFVGPFSNGKLLLNRAGDFSLGEFNGYIIEFKDEPVLIYKNKNSQMACGNNICESGETSQNCPSDCYSGCCLSNNQCGAFSQGQCLGLPGTKWTGSCDVNSKSCNFNGGDSTLVNYRDYKQNLKRKQNNFINSLKTQYPQYSFGTSSSATTQIKIMNQFTDVFNGLSINAPQDVISEIKKNLEVKRVVPNYKVHTMLMDSVPLINADDVWKLDADGNNCQETGKECLTGKGVTIGIIDTGVDYTHEDLGGCTVSYYDSEYCFDKSEKVIERSDGGTCTDYDGGLNICHGTETKVVRDRGDGLMVQDFYYDGCDNDYLFVRENTCSDDGNVLTQQIPCPEGTRCSSGKCEKTDVDLSQCNKVIGGYDFVNNDNNPMDDHGHGTHVAATAAGNWVLKGVAPGASIVAYKVLTAEGWGYFDWIIGGIEMSVDPNKDGDYSDHLDVISLSLGGPGDPDDTISTAIDNAVDNGVVAVIAAGNSGPGEQTIGSPGTARKAITVGATDKSDQIAYFSSRGPVIWTDTNGQEQAIIKPDIVAPGVDICAAEYDSAWSGRKCLDDKHISISGTSMATPHVSGAVALLLQKNPDWGPDEIKMALKNTAIDTGEDIYIQGYGRIDIGKATNCSFLDNFHQNCSKIPEIMGKLNISSKPSEADVYIKSMNSEDYNYMGKTPLLFESRTGERTIKVSYDGYFDNITTINLDSDIKNINFALKYRVDLLYGFSYGKGELLIDGNNSKFGELNHLDFNNDGYMDILASGSNYVFFISNQGNNKFNFSSTDCSSVIYYPSLVDYMWDTTHISPADFDNDGIFELVYGGTLGYIKLLSIPKDKKEEIISLNIGESILYRGFNLTLKALFPESGSFSLNANFLDYPSFSGVIGFWSSCGLMKVYEGISATSLNMNGNSATFKLNQYFETKIIGKFDDTSVANSMGDFDNDGIKDFITSNGNQVVFFRNNGNKEFNEFYPIYSMPERITDLYSADFDNDGDLDILVSYGLTDYITPPVDNYKDFEVIDLLENLGKDLKGNLFFRNHPKIIKRGQITHGSIPLDHRINLYMTSFDFNHDGFLDIITGDNSGIIEFFSNQRDYNFRSEGDLSNYEGLSSGIDSFDIDGDGDIDLLTTSSISYSKNKLYLHINNFSYQCQDGKDNDNDGKIDYPNDFSCSSLQDNDETNPKAQCQDNLDNDGDGKCDYGGCTVYCIQPGPGCGMMLRDTDCESLNDNSESTKSSSPYPCNFNKICETALGENMANCPYDCQVASYCGNGIIETYYYERCDDKNNVNGDGCSSSCKIESGYSCSGQPSVCKKSSGGISCGISCPPSMCDTTTGLCRY